MSLTGCQQLAEDAIHSAFARLCQMESGQIEDLTSYTFACVRNAAMDRLRNQKRSDRLTESLFEQSSADITTALTPEDLLLESERDTRLRSAVDSLPTAEREVVVMKIYSGLTFDFIGRVLEQPAKTVATRYRRALIKLEDKLRGHL